MTEPDDDADDGPRASGAALVSAAPRRPTDPSPKARRATVRARGPVAARRAAAAAAVAGALVWSVAACGPSYDPYASGIPEARAAAVEAVDEVASRIALSDRVTVLAEGRADGCGTHSDGPLFAGPTGYFCVLGWMVTLVVPGATTREEVAGVIDAEMRSTDVEYTSPIAVDLVLSYPSVRDGTILRGGGHAGGTEIRVEITPFRSGTWTPPRIPRGSADVSTEGDLEDLTAADVEATGARDVVTVEVTTTYWDTTRDDGGDTREPDRPVPPLAVEHFSEGSRYAFDVALPTPSAAADACAQDAAVDPPSVVSVSTPFPRTTFALGPEATSDDMQRVRGCLTSGLDSGAVAVLTPHE